MGEDNLAGQRSGAATIIVSAVPLRFAWVTCFSIIHECNDWDDDPFVLLSFIAMAMMARRTYSRFQPDFIAAATKLSMEGSKAKRQAVR
ncbi:hypothetical protein ACXHMN_31195 [Rhizobium sp. LEGMi12c]